MVATIKDRTAMVWTQLAGQPVKMGTLYVTEKEARFSYEDTYTALNQRGLGLIYDPAVFTSTIVFNRNEFFDLHPPLQSLIPPRNEDNFSRSLVLRYLDKINVQYDKGFDADWKIMMFSGHGTIGHLDVFESDKAAEAWYSTPSKKGLVELDEKFGFSLKHFMTWYDAEAESIIDIIGPTPSVGGAIPKLALSINKTGWDGRIGLPRRFGDTDRTDVLLKLENTNQYPGIVELETLGLQIHKEAGFEVPRFWPVKIKGLSALAIERFDRTPDGRPVFTETVHSVLASGAPSDINNHYSATYDQIGLALSSKRIALVNDRKKAKQHLFERLVMAMLTGNGDLHLQNLSFIDRNGEVEFSPVYDPVPMRAYSIHDALIPQGMTFGDYGDFAGDHMVGFAEGIERFGKSLGLKKKTMLAIIERLLNATQDYDKRIMELKTLPKDYKDNLIRVTNIMRRDFMDI